MDCPGFCITEFGVFDSGVKFPRTKTTQPRQLELYELEFFAADCPGQAYIDGQWYPMAHNTFICAKPGMVRKSILPFKCYYLHIQAQDSTLIKILDRIPVYGPLRVSQEFIGLFNQMLTADSSDPLLMSSCVLRIIRLMSLQLDHGTADRAYAHHRALLELEHYIREHLSEELSLASLAQLCNLSPTYFHTIFTEYFHKTPAQYILDCRIAAAKTRLLTGDYSLSELAADCGFSSQSYFCYKFKQITGQTPGQYRKEQLRKLNI